MKIYDLLLKEDNNHNPEDLIALKDGFSSYAFAFGPLWFLYHRMWKCAVTLVLIFFGVAAVKFGELNLFLVQVAISIIVGINANAWLAASLAKRRNYKFLACVVANNELDAKLKVARDIDINNQKFIEPGQDFISKLFVKISAKIPNRFKNRFKKLQDFKISYNFRKNFKIFERFKF